MDFSLTDEQQLLLESLDELMERSCSEQYMKECDANHEWPHEFTDALLENGFQMLGVDEEFGKEGIASPLVTAPFCAVKMQFFAHDQMGGLVANTKAQVCKRSEHVGPDPVKLDDQEVIPHLYAAGECVGGYVGCDRGHGKISMYMVFGRIAARELIASA